MVNCLLETLKNHPAFDTMPNGLKGKAHSIYHMTTTILIQKDFKRSGKRKLIRVGPQLT